jgi:carbon storage regulator
MEPPGRGEVAMLVLSRKRNESIVIDGNIVVTIVDIRGDKVRLGIEAPKEVPIHRSEVYEALKRGNAPAEPTEAAPPPKDLSDSHPSFQV